MAAAADDTSAILRVELACPECGGPCEAGLWDATGQCGYCGSLLAFGSDLDRDIFTVADADASTADLLEVVVRSEASRYRSRLMGRIPEEQRDPFDAPPHIEVRVARHAARVRASLELQHRVDFFAAYRIRQDTIVQGLLGRRRSAKESFLRCFRTEEIERLYDPAEFNLRDRGLKIQGFRLRRLDQAHLELSQNRFLPLCPQTPDPARTRYDRSRLPVEPGTQVIGRFAVCWRERTLTVWKHFTYACLTQDGRELHLLFDQQFGTLAARLSEAESDVFLGLLGQDLWRMIPAPDVRAVASECPDCGFEDLVFPEGERIVFCPNCGHAVGASPKGLELVRYRVGLPPTPRPGQEIVYVPFWCFPFRVSCGGKEYRRIWDWLAAVSPNQRTAEAFREHDPAESRLFIPARELLGARPLDDAFVNLTSVIGWRQPELRAERPQPGSKPRMLGVELSAADARALARPALLALHDNSSTRRLNARNLREVVEQAELPLGPAELCALPLPMLGGTWSPPGARFAVPLPLLESRGALPFLTRGFHLS